MPQRSAELTSGLPYFWRRYCKYRILIFIALHNFKMSDVPDNKISALRVRLSKYFGRIYEQVACKNEE